MSSRFIILLLLTTLLSACVPQERFWWAPDGKTAAVLIDGHLRISNGAGILSPPFPMENSEARVVQAEWLPDGSKVLVTRILPAADWEDLKTRLHADESRRVESLADGMPSLLQAALLAGGDIKNAGALLNRVLPNEPEIATSALLLSLQRNRAEILSSAVKAPQVRASLKEISEKQPYLFHELCLIDPADENPIQNRLIVEQTIRALGGAKASPSHSFVAYAKRDGKGQSVSIEIRSLENPAKSLSFANGVYATFDWTPDGNSLVYVAPAGPIDSVAKTVRVAEVFDQNGKLNTGETTAQSKSGYSATDLATAFIPFLPRVECLPDGHVLFAAQSGERPVAGNELPGDAKLFRVSLSTRQVSTIPTRDGHLPMNLSHFVPSPDGKRVAVVESDSNAVALVDLATGETEFIASPQIKSNCRTLPAWRNKDELSYALPDGKGGVTWVLRVRDGSLYEMSQDWPQEALADWMEYPDEQSNNTSD